MIIPQFYKYLDLSGVRATLSTGRIKMSRASEFNDPFDLNVRNLRGFNVSESLADGRKALIQMLRDNPIEFARRCGVDEKEVIRISGFITILSQSELDKLNKMLDIQTISMELSLIKEGEAVITQYETAAVFCASLIHDDPLMWAHYAGKHSGAVLGFKPNANNDSILTVLEPVQYVANPPDIMPYGLERPDKEKFLKEAKQIYYYKHESWRYEQEVRLYIPSEISPPHTFTLMKFPPDELTDIYLGYRMPDHEKEEIISLAKALNPQIIVHHAKIEKGGYRLLF